ncbi:hypothetical protein ALP10_200248 [Pseudomonas syringae pv. helianthi]|uniref:Uncharacterized protein n=1 Tax=Pseudomonas syringae pv. helianthi TaxID=251654 RepID=A0A3M6CG82_9PSED|nr:hypothetical protein ALP10_200248 [Pseudomonas syringae pv. helianthi]
MARSKEKGDCEKVIISCPKVEDRETRLRTLSRVHVGIISTRRLKEECHLLLLSYNSLGNRYKPIGT